MKHFINIYAKLTSWLVLPILVGIVVHTIGSRWQLSVLLSLFVFGECYNSSRLVDMYMKARATKKRILIFELVLWTLALVVAVSACLCIGDQWFFLGLILSAVLIYQIVVVLPAGIFILLGHAVCFGETLLPGEKTFNSVLLWVFNHRRAWLLASVILTVSTIVLPCFIANPSFLTWKEITRVLGFCTALFCLVLPLSLSVGPDEYSKRGNLLLDSPYYMSGFCLIVITIYSLL